MDEHPDSALHYGHVGRAVYLPETKTWTFSRSFIQPPSISYTGLTKTTVPTPLIVIKPDRSIETIRPPDQKLIPNAHPDLATHWSIIRDDSFSKFVTTINDLYDPQVSSLLDLGFAVDLGNDDVKIRPSPVAIAAVVTGECGNTVSFRVMVEDTAELIFEDSALRVPSIGDAETTEWSSHGAPILQICFARPAEDDEEKATWMAARMSDSTVVFRPLYQRDRVSMHIQNEDIATLSMPLRNSRLDANPAVKISKEYTGTFPHAGVAFNPWYQKQLAIVDTAGNWSIWEIMGREKRRKANWTATPGPKGSLTMEDKPSANGPRHDGWASIEWIADFSTILVADRRSAMLFQITGDNIRSSIIELSMGKQSEWILDVRRSTQHKSHFFVLTTSRLLWFDSTGTRPNEMGLRPTLHARLAWRHFRDPEDTTLRFSELVMNGDLHLVLYSRLAELVQVFPCPFVADDQMESIAVSDPFLLDVPSVVDVSSIEQTNLAHYSNFVFREVAHSVAPVSKAHHNPGLTLVKLFWIDSSLAVHETIFKGPDKNVSEQDLNLEEDSSLMRLKRHRPIGKDRDIDDENFVVDDWDESVDACPSDPQPSPHVMPTITDTDLDWTLNWEPVYGLAVGTPEAARQSGLEQQPATLDQMIEKLENDMTESLTDGRASETMLELTGGRPVLHDIDKNAHDLARLVSTALSQHPYPQGQPGFMALPLRLSKLFHGMPTSSHEKQLTLDLLETYDRLVHEWLTDLPHDIPDLTRRMKEKIIRGVALDLLLARLIRVSNEPSDDKAPPPAQSADVDRGADRRVTSPPDLRPQLSSSQIPLSQTLAVRERRFQADGASGDRPKEAPAPVYSNLAAFTTFKEPRAMPRNVANLLFHWQTGANPATYEWQKTSHLLDEREGASGPTTPRHRLRKKRSQRIVAPDPSSLPPTPVALTTRNWGSQPEHPPSTFPLPSSQPTMEEPMTQMERGQFGTREVKKSGKNKKKRRAAGF
ncbi:uncharacterized protein N7459_003694 [Penicillium hispanicum]|uniref:uncharacterized protein n=1 Tax=Penicillium hispanicum TaxID=1080232 RepID=UPI002540B101|nr:uncharacterized protein N7459_003694 [Penicillium hispanicum]KAJ5587929.1 hypothetical protein N7459_003694 [Penicillium hispanicum]